MTNIVRWTPGYDGGLLRNTSSPTMLNLFPYNYILPTTSTREAFMIGIGYPPAGIYTNGYPTMSQVQSLQPGQINQGMKPKKLIAKNGAGVSRYSSMTKGTLLSKLAEMLSG